MNPNRVFLSVVLASFLTAVARGDDDGLRFFENSVRPLLVEQCQRCHGAQKQSGGLRLDGRMAVLQGGESGAAVVPGKPAESLLLQAVRHEGGLKMPPDKRLDERQVQTLTRWIELGAPWTAEAPAAESIASRAARHWAFQPLRAPQPPEVKNGAWCRTPVDRFVLAGLETAGLTPAPEADRRTLLRRLAYTLTGLPPSPEEVAAFVDDPDPRAYERLVERWLESPQFGEHAARRWLDIARYSDTKGYVYAREERFWVHAWTYRDWVVRAFNADLPYDRFLTLQLAADLVDAAESPDRSAEASPDRAALGYLTLGRRFLGVKHEILDDRIDVVGRGMMGLTLGCARCHDHKYDPLSIADYYALYGVFDSCTERLQRLGGPADEAFEKELKTRQDKLQTRLAASRDETSQRVRQRTADYLQAQTELHKYPGEGFDQIFQKSDLLPAFVHRWERYLRDAGERRDPAFRHWHAYAALPPDDFAAQASLATQRLAQPDAGPINRLVAAAFASPPQSMRDVIERYGQLFAAAMKATNEADADTAELRRVLFDPSSPCLVPDEPIVTTETLYDSGTCTDLWKLQGEVDRWIIQSGAAVPFALGLVDRPTPARPRIFRRGNPLNQGEEVPRRVPALLSRLSPAPFGAGSGRLELARAIVHPDNPLTARVAANRIWQQHFARGLVSTPSDFGLRAEPPTHPELLDWLATQLISGGWKLKSLHRTLLLSATFRQASQGASAERVDPSNRRLWRMNDRRLGFEEFRDSLLAATGQLELRSGGKPVDLFKSPFPARRTLYGLVDRQFFPSTLRVFDFANPDLHVPQRGETTVPQQALFFLNHPFVLEQAKALAQRASADADPVRTLFQRTLQRDPTPDEAAEAQAFVRAAETGSSAGPAAPPTAPDWQYGYGAVDEAAGRVTGFARLPHFSGQAWQGGPSFPDGKLGWVQLTATGGHPGNDRQHASVRRWTAPRAMTIEVRSELKHDAQPGDGIRAFVVGSRGGIAATATVHQKSAAMNVERRAVEAGETIDFVVDIGQVLNSDQYLWTATIRELNPPGATWNSQSDFPRATTSGLSAWEQLAHVLLCTNEFLFVD